MAASNVATSEANRAESLPLSNEATQSTVWGRTYAYLSGLGNDLKKMAERVGSAVSEFLSSAKNWIQETFKNCCASKSIKVEDKLPRVEDQEDTPAALPHTTASSESVSPESTIPASNKSSCVIM